MRIAIDGALSNGEVGLLVDEPVLLNEPEGVLCLTADQWSSLIQQRAAAGRPLHLAEVR
ncbi:hypothetical protein [Stenotrophomonas sp.]|uniref:hypothetical protein n=1 Tax=Stenotrophomonas sp. TaxID=69392 RepID=UPI0028AD3733|nr:hypothetical protein [Stenotrophomonas sp.]